MEFNIYSPVDLFIGGVLFLIMFGIGLSLTPESFRKVFLAPGALIFGLIAQMIAFPVIAFCVVYFVDIPAALKVGFIVLAACPGGTTAGFISYLFRGNVALSISLTAINSFLTLLSIPFIVNIALFLFMGQTTELHLPYVESIIQIVVVAILPALLGVMIRMKYETFALAIQKPLKIILILLLATVFLIKFLADENNGGTGITRPEILMILPYAVIINVLGFFAGYLIGRWKRLDLRSAYTIAIEVTMQNTTLAFLVAGTLLQNQDMVKPALIYSLFSFWTAIILTWILKKWKKRGLFEEF